jgi:hypothetical protein
VIDKFYSLELNKVITRRLGVREHALQYQYHDVISNLFWIYFCGGDHIEDIGEHLRNCLEYRPDTKICSPDTLLRCLNELSVENVTYTSESGNAYDFNLAPQLNELLLDLLVSTRQLTKGMVDLDFDHQFLPTEKSDTKYSCKKKRGYFPGVATIGDLIVGIENRDANTNVKFKQEGTLQRLFKRPANRGVYVNRCRMDCGSFSQRVIAMVQAYSRHFFIRASRSETQQEEINKITDWQVVEINGITNEIASIPFTSFLQEQGFKLAVQREVRPDGDQTLFEGKYTYRCILTNDNERSDLDVILFYNARGASERTFDCMNNDFGWKNLPCSLLKQNAVFLLFTAMAKNFYQYLIAKISTVFKNLKPASRLKKFIFRFITVPAKWVYTGRQWILKYYTSKEEYRFA